MNPYEPTRGGRPFTVFISAGEESGDFLGANLMDALADRLNGQVRFVGIGGEHMAAAGLRSLLPLEGIALHGYSAVVARLPSLIARIRRTASAVTEVDPDVLVLIDAPAFNLRVGKIVRRNNPAIAIVDYVSPTVWAYFPWRAKRMAKFVDHVLAILPFEPATHRDLGGPPCTFVGHPAAERRDLLRPEPGERSRLANTERPILLALPGSRRGEIARLMRPFGETVALVNERFGPVRVVLPTVSHLVAEVRERAAEWPVAPQIVVGANARYAAFRSAHAALAASGTVTLELAFAGVPMVVAYRIDPLARLVKHALRAAGLLRRVFTARSIVLPNLIVDANVVPEFVDRDSHPERLAEALMPLLEDSRERSRQLAAFDRIDDLMALNDGTPSSRAAETVIETVRRHRLHAALERRPASG